MNLKRLTLALLAATVTALAQNLIPNPFFVDGVDAKGVPNGWVYDCGETECKFSVVTEDGRNCFKLERSGMTAPICRISAYADKIVPAGDYVISVDMKSVGTAGDFILYDFSPDGKYKIFNMTFDKKNHGWQTAFAAFKASPQCTKFKISLAARNTDGPVYFTNVRMMNVDEAPKAILHKLEAEPALDANWDAPIWEQADKTSPYYMLGKEYKTADAASSTLSKFAYTDGILHIITRQ